MTQTLTPDIIGSWRRSLARAEVGLDLDDHEDRVEFRSALAEITQNTPVATLRALVLALGADGAPPDRYGLTMQLGDLWTVLRNSPRPPCDHCGQPAVFEVDVLAYDGDMLERLRYCPARLRERIEEEGVTQIGAVRRLGTEPLYVIGADEQ